MKKIFSFLCMISLVMSVSAANMLGQKTELKSAKAFKSLKAEKVAPVANIEFKKEHRMAPMAATTNLFKAPAQTQGALTVNAIDCGVFVGWQSYSGWELYFGQTDGSTYWNEVLYFHLDNGSENQLAGSYSSAAGEIDLTYAYVVAQPGDTLSLTSATMTVAYLSTNSEGYPVYSFVISVEASNGQTYTVNTQLPVDAYDPLAYQYCQAYGVYCDDVVVELDDAPFVPTGDTIEINVSKHLVSERPQTGYSVMTFEGYDENDDDLGVYFAFIDDGSGFTGTYNTLDGSDSYAVILVGSQQIDLKTGQNQSAVVTYNEPNGSIVATVIAKDGNVYEINFPFVFGEVDPVGDPIELTIEAEVSDDYVSSYEYWDIFGWDETHTYGIELFGKFGTELPAEENFTEADLMYFRSAIYENVDGSLVENDYIHIADITIAYEEPEGVLTATIITKDGKQFDITMNFVYGAVPPTGDTIQVATIGWCPMTYYPSYEDYQITGEGEDYAAGFDFLVPAEGQYVGNYSIELENIDLEYCYVYDYAAETELAVVDAEATITEANDTVFVDAYLLCEDGIVYHVTFKHYTITPLGTIPVEFTQTAAEVFETEAGDPILYAAGKSNNVMVQFYVWLDEAIDGTYTEADCYGLNNYNSTKPCTYIALSDGTGFSLAQIAYCEITVVSNGDGTLTVTGSIIEGYTEYEFTFEIIVSATALENVKVAAEAEKTIENGHVVIKKNGAKYNAAGMKL